MQGKQGDLYGTTFNGGTDGGTIFRMSLSGDLTTIASLDYTNGWQLYNTDLTMGKDGNLYGVAASGGLTTDYAGYVGGDGTIFRVTTNGLLTTLVYFGRTNGAYAYAQLAQGRDGNFYGGTDDGGAHYGGTFFRMSPGGNLTTLVDLTIMQGRDPNGPFIEAADGSFYGSTFGGGPSSSNAPYGSGTVFKLTTNGVLTTIAAFDGTTGRPYNMILAEDGSFYGTTLYPATVFKVTPAGALSVLVWLGGWYGDHPRGALLQASDHFLYGTTDDGGDFGQGNVYRINTSGLLENVISFDGTNGAGPMSRLIQAADGDLYGTTYSGGASNLGTIFRISFRHLDIAKSGDSLILSWPTNQVGFVLQCSDKLSPSNWVDCTNQLSISGDKFCVTNPVSTGAQFFRLRK
jgi:uncharacterized repeat protein (TIGR03803 family)